MTKREQAIDHIRQALRLLGVPIGSGFLPRIASLELLRSALMAEALHRAEGNKELAARVLGVSRGSIQHWERRKPP